MLRGATIAAENVANLNIATDQFNNQAIPQF